MMLDLQLARLASPTTDIAFFLYISLHGEVRRANLDLFLTRYHSVVSQVLQDSGRGVAVPFTLQELRQEYSNKRELGLIFGIWNLMLLHCNTSGITDSASAGGEDMQKTEEEKREENMKVLETNATFRSRLLALFNDTHEFETVC